jgi:hypothetical protein
LHDICVGENRHSCVSSLSLMAIRDELNIA